MRRRRIVDRQTNSRSVFCCCHTWAQKVEKRSDNTASERFAVHFRNHDAYNAHERSDQAFQMRLQQLSLLLILLYLHRYRHHTQIFFWNAAWITIPRLKTLNPKCGKETQKNKKESETQRETQTERHGEITYNGLNFLESRGLCFSFWHDNSAHQPMQQLGFLH